jgi:hypothetical protein
MSLSVAGLTLAQLQARSPRSEGLLPALRAEVEAGRVRCENGVYSVVTEAFPRHVLAAFLALTELSTTPPSTTQPSTTSPITNRAVHNIESREQLQLTADLEALLTAEPFGLSCNALARKMRRRRTDVLAALDTDPRFLRVGKTNGRRWRLAPMTEGVRDRTGRTLQPPLGRALGHLMLNRLEAAERELAALKAQHRDEEMPAA